MTKNTQNKIPELQTGYRTNNTLTYSFCMNNIDTTEYVTNKMVAPEDTEDRFLPIFAAWENVANIKASLNTDTQRLCIARGDITTPNIAGLTFNDFDASTFRIKESQIYFEPDTINDSYLPGTFAYKNAMHEIGHALGLKHPFEIPPILPASENNMDFTLMSYTVGRHASAFNPTSGQNDLYPATPMIYDIAAMQSLYNPNVVYMSGDTIYRFDAASGSITAQDSFSTPKPLPGRVVTLWDADGEDVINLSNLPYNVGLEIGILYQFTKAIHLPARYSA